MCFSASSRVCLLRRSQTAAGFTLIELLVTVSVVCALAALMAPSLRAALEKSRQAHCAHHIRQLAAANHLYAADTFHFVAAAEDIWTTNRKRWHGERTSVREPFDPSRSPLARYIGESGRVKECPSLRVREPGFEAGCGGYGYNARGIGSQAYLGGTMAGAARGMPSDRIAAPSRTVMFTDAAFLDVSGRRTRLIEYSFAEAYFHLADNRAEETHQAVPSIHFRHSGKAAVSWVDGHVSFEPMTVSYSDRHTRAGIGWFGPTDNSLFDPF